MREPHRKSTKACPEIRDSTDAQWRTIDPTGVVERAGYWLTCAEEALGWYYGVVFNGHTLKRTADGWLLIVRATKKGHKIVCFMSGPTIVDCIRNLAWGCKSKTIKWKEDLY